MKSKKLILIICSVIILMIVSFIILITPKTVLKYTSDDNKIIVLITESVNFDLSPSRNQDYTLIVKMKDGIINKTLLKKDFNFYADCSGIASCFVNVEWHNNSVTITIDSEEMNKKEFNVSW